MASIFSLVTAVYDGGQTYLREAYESVRRQRTKLPAGWELEWVIQEDGTSGVPAKTLPHDQWITTGMARRGGAGVARTTALSRAHGELVRTLDADDLLTDGAIARDIETMAAHPSIGWCISAGIDLLPDGSTRPGPYDPPNGPLSYQDLLAAYDRDLFPVLGTHITVRTPLLLALGGWSALPAWETVAIVLRCAAVSTGHMISQPGGFYRKHPQQTTADPTYAEAVGVSGLRTTVRAQAEALRLTGWRWDR
ncbi:glycosyltransferase (plasmid) [Streptomyces sp. NBC_01754]|uniref:glycosyltransferase n=1 Tax=Streptomyces sp. NBC_01754 TaxID=2975930 RepID=UPI002DDA6672|nr:glycosyltransferase [Streptomyces sp. NBC_01754]WSC97073.1 glycosyltransferase [Streptomyces sp. NBC_01754]